MPAPIRKTPEAKPTSPTDGAVQTVHQAAVDLEAANKAERSALEGKSAYAQEQVNKFTALPNDLITQLEVQQHKYNATYTKLHNVIIAIEIHVP